MNSAWKLAALGCFVLVGCQPPGGSDQTLEDLAPTSLAFVAASAPPSADGTLPPVEVELRDRNGHRTSAGQGLVTLSLENGVAGASLIGVSEGTPTRGLVSFPGLALHQAGTGYVLVARSPGLVAARSEAFSVGAGAPARLEWVHSPGNFPVGQPLPRAQVCLVDSWGNLCTESTASVGLRLQGGAESPVVHLPPPARLVSGLATFDGFTVGTAGRGYVLVATLPPFTAESHPFDIE